MAVIKKNIWLLFWLMLFASTTVFSYYVYYLWERNNEEFLQFQHTQVHLISNSLSNFLKSQESLLEILGNQLAVDKAIPITPVHSPILDRVRKTHPSVAGLGLANLDGDLVAVSSNLTLTKLPNLLAQKTSRDSFISTINSEKLTVGRTYLLDALKEKSMAMAIRKAIKNDSGQVVAVMTAGINVTQPAHLNDNLDFHHIDIIREDGYRQLSSRQDDNVDIYGAPIPSAVIEQMLIQAILQNNVNEQTIKSTMTPYAIVFDFGQGLQSALIEYDPYFHFWVVSQIDSEYIYGQFTSKIVMALTMFSGACFFFLLMVRSISRTEIERLNELRYLALHDVLTGLPNQRHFNQLINEPEHDKLSIIYVNIDRFKTVNDSYGHSFGDDILIEIASRLKSFAPHEGSLTRGIGDEFFLVSHIINDSDLSTICNNIQHALSQPYASHNVNFLLSASIAVTKYPEHGKNEDELKRSLDFAMIQAKNTKNTICFVTPEMQRKNLEHLRIEHKLRQAIKERNIFMAYQPQINVAGQMCGMEALARWIDDELGFVPPDKFISIAETSGLMLKLGELILELVFDDISHLQKDNKQTINVSINISVIQLLQNNFVDHLLDRLHKYNLSAANITLEITESVFIEDINHIKPKLERLIGHGITFSMDDFGTGYSSLNLLSKLPIKELKIDKSFVDQIDTNYQSRLMVENIIDIGKNHGMTILAEGIENDHQKQILARSGCDSFQGYLFAKPMKIEELSRYSASL